jgi:RNA polymerase sigma factor (sigma-70 family)
MSKTTLVPEQNVDFNFELTQGFAASYIRRKARELSRQPGFSRSDREDLQQQLCVRVLERLPQFDPQQGCFNAFVKLIVRQFAANARRHNRAEMRDRTNDASLNVLVDGEEGPLELAQTIGRHELNARLSREERPVDEAIDLATDVAQFVASLPTRLRHIAERLQERSPAQVAAELGVHLSTVYRDLKLLRERFAKAGLQEYLKSMRRFTARAGSSSDRGPTHCKPDQTKRTRDQLPANFRPTPCGPAAAA